REAVVDRLDLRHDSGRAVVSQPLDGADPERGVRGPRERTHEREQRRDQRYDRGDQCDPPRSPEAAHLAPRSWTPRGDAPAGGGSELHHQDCTVSASPVLAIIQGAELILTKKHLTGWRKKPARVESFPRPRLHPPGPLPPI